MTFNATRNLPSGYIRLSQITLTKNKSLFVWINLLGVVVFFLSGWLFYEIAAFIRPKFHWSQFFLEGKNWLLIPVFIFSIVLHEIIHGIFFYIYTGEKAKFGFKGFYAYAGAPDWYIPKWKYLVVGLSPLVSFILLGFLIIPFIPINGIIWILFAVVFNTAGATGDLIVSGWVLGKPKTALINDTGDTFSLYIPGETSQVFSNNLY